MAVLFILLAMLSLAWNTKFKKGRGCEWGEVRKGTKERRKEEAREGRRRRKGKRAGGEIILAQDDNLYSLPQTLDMNIERESTIL